MNESCCFRFLNLPKLLHPPISRTFKQQFQTLNELHQYPVIAGWANLNKRQLDIKFKGNYMWTSKQHKHSVNTCHLSPSFFTNQVVSLIIFTLFSFLSKSISMVVSIHNFSPIYDRWYNVIQKEIKKW